MGGAAALARKAQATADEALVRGNQGGSAVGALANVKVNNGTTALGPATTVSQLVNLTTVESGRVRIDGFISAADGTTGQLVTANLLVDGVVVATQALESSAALGKVSAAFGFYYPFPQNAALTLAAHAFLIELVAVGTLTIPAADAVMLTVQEQPTA
jgi:hypothetical protein